MSKYINPDQSFLQGARYRKGGGKGGGGGGGGINQEVLDLVNKGTFKPFSLSTSAGTGSGTAEGQFTGQASDVYSGIQEGALSNVGQFLPQIADQFSREAQQFNFTGQDLGQVQQQLFDEQSALLQPAFEQQRQQLKSDLFGSGRMGLSVADSAAGAGGTGGFVNPDAFGLGRAQSQTLAELAAGTRAQALGEQAQQFGLQSQQFNINEAMQQQRAQNLLSGAGGLFGLGSAVSEQELALLQAGSQAEAMRGQSFIGGAGALASAIQPEKDSGGKGLLGSAIGAAGNVAAAKVSDIRLKDNINKVGELANGLNLYTWTWNKVAKAMGIEDQEVGVLAQEVLEVMPHAVTEGLDGYYRVNYSEVLNG